MKKLLSLEFFPRNPDLGLLLLRIGLGLSLVFFHGWGKLVKLLAGSAAAPDVLHIGAMPTTVLAVLAEVVCAVLVILGLWTRFAALWLVVELGCVFVLAHKMALTGPGNGEKPLLFLFGFLLLLLTGAGKYSFDKK